MVALSAALLQKVALRSPKWRGSTRAHSRAQALRLRAEELIDLDSQAFLDYLEARRSGDGVEAARQRTIEMPREIAGCAAEVVSLAADLETHGNPNLRPDAVAAGTLALVAGKTADMLVRINASAPRQAAPDRSGGPDRAS